MKINIRIFKLKSKVKQIKDNFWIFGVVFAGLLIINIFMPYHRRLDCSLNIPALEEDRVGFEETSLLVNAKPALCNRHKKASVPLKLCLPLTLSGTLISHTSSAFIHNSEENTCRLYKVGDVVCGAQIMEISPGRVLVKKGAIFKELTLAGGGRPVMEVGISDMPINHRL